MYAIPHRIHGTGIFTYIYRKKSSECIGYTSKYTSPIDPMSYRLLEEMPNNHLGCKTLKMSEDKLPFPQLVRRISSINSTTLLMSSTIPKTNSKFAPENRPNTPKRTFIFHPFSGAMLVSWRVIHSYQPCFDVKQKDSASCKVFLPSPWNMWIS